MQLGIQISTIVLFFSTIFCSENYSVKQLENYDGTFVMGLPKELAYTVLSFCDKKSYIALFAANKMLRSMTIFRTPMVYIDLQTGDIRSIPWVYNKLFNGYTWLTGTKPFNKELANPKTMVAASLVASGRLQVKTGL